MNKLDEGHLYDEPLHIVVEGRAVVLLGPDAVALSLTPEAAERSAALLVEAAREALQAPAIPPD